MIKITGIALLALTLVGCTKTLTPIRLTEYTENFPNGYWILTKQDPIPRLNHRRVNSVIRVSNGSNTVDGIHQFPTCDTHFTATGEFSGEFPYLIMTIQTGPGVTQVNTYKFLASDRLDPRVTFYFDIQPEECPERQKDDWSDFDDD